MIPAAYLAKGNYFSCSARAPFSRLIYPVPEPGGLGVHLTLDMAGQARFGPDVEWVEQIDYAVDPARAAERFYPAIRNYWPTLPDGALVPGYAGIRPKLHDATQPMPDFRIDGPQMSQPRAGQPAGHRNPRPDQLAGDRRTGGGAVGGVSSRALAVSASVSNVQLSLPLASLRAKRSNPDRRALHPLGCFAALALTGLSRAAPSPARLPLSRVASPAPSRDWRRRRPEPARSRRRR